MFWWSSALVVLAFGSQIQIEASNLTIAANYESFPTIASQDSVPSQQQFASGKLSRRAKLLKSVHYLEQQQSVLK